MADSGIRVHVYGDYDDKDIKKAQRDLDSLKRSAPDASSKFSKLGGALKGAGIAVAAGFAVAGTAAVAFGKDAVSAASDLGEVQSKVDVVFGPKQAANIKAWSESASTAFGQSTTQALNAASSFAVFGKSAGLRGKELSGFSTSLTELASDLSSFHNVDVQQATEAIAAGLRGESEPLRALGVLLDDASLKQEIFAQTGKKVTGTLTPQQKVLAAQGLIMKQTADAQGDFARTSDGLANSQRTLSAVLEDVQAQVGTALLPAITEVVQAIGPMLSELTGPLGEVAAQIGGALSEAFQKLSPVLPVLAEALGTVAGILGDVLATAIDALVPIITPLLNLFSDLAQRIGPILKPLLQKVGELLGKLLAAVEPLLAPLMDLVFGILEAAMPIVDVLADVLGILIDALAPLLEIVASLLQPLGQLINVLLSAILPIIKPVLPVIEMLATVLGDILARAIGIIITAVGGLIVAFSKLAPFVLNNVTKPVVDFFLTMAESIVDSAATAFGWVPGLGDKLNGARDAIKEFKNNATKAIGEAADTIGTEGEKIGKGLIDQGIALVTDPAEAQKVRKAGQGVGTNLADGMAQGIKIGTPNITSQARQSIRQAEQAAKDEAQVKSPSKVWAKIGLNLSEGLAQGIKDGGDKVRAAMQDSYVTWFEDTRTKLKESLDKAKADFQSFHDTVAGAITGAIDFGSIAPEFNDKGERVGLSFMEALQAQATKAKEFAEKVKLLIASGLSKDALQQVLAAGVDAGTNIANELISGGSEAITTTNELVASTQAAADSVGTLAAEKWYGTGVKAAQDTYTGFKDNFGKGGPAYKAIQSVMDNLAASMSRSATITVTTINRQVNEVIGSFGGKTVKGATGGIVTRPTFALIGEAGPEAVVPLNRTPGSSPLGNGMGGNSYTINVQAGVGDPRQIGQQVVEYIKRFEKANGAVFAAA